MGRWEPNAAGRLRQAAMALFQERGYEQTTVADIAERAGLTARTFFRYFTDKREVLFAGSDELEHRAVAALEHAPPGVAPLTAVGAALDEVARMIGGHRAMSAQRQEVIEANAELRERELIKMASLSRAVADALRRRGVDDVEASLAAETGVAVFRVGYERWLRSPEERELGAVLRESLAQLRDVATAG